MSFDKASPDSLATPWNMVVETVQPHVVRLSTPSGWGTGFFLANAAGGTITAVATAAHVVQHAHLWEDPIRIHHPASGAAAVLRHNERAMRVDAESDTAVLVFPSGGITFPADPMGLAPKGRHLTVGVEIGWLGFPAIPAADLCFFHGRISAWSDALGAYLVDGNAINGVSGGPTVAVVRGTLHLIGVVSAYAPNRATGEALPGLAVVRSVERFHDEVAAIKSFDEAKATETPASPPADLPPAEPGAPTRGRS